MPPHFTDDFVLDGGDVSELAKPPVRLGLGEFCFNRLLEHDPQMTFLIEAMSGRECSCREFLELSVNIALGLRDVGIGQGMKVCLVGRNSIDICAAGVATWLIGAVLTPFDPSMRAFEYQHMLSLVEPSILICDEDIMEDIEKAIQQLPDLEILCYTIQENDTDKNSLNNIIYRGKDKGVVPEDFSPVSVDTDEVAVIPGSSGSTGLPKAVELSSYNLLFAAAIVSKTLSWLPNSVFLHTSHFYWISGLFMYVTSISYGLKRILVEEVDEITVLQAMDKYKPGFALMSPSLVNGVVQHPDFGLYDSSTMSLIIAAGSPLKLATVDIVKELWSENLTLVQGYGLTELSGCYLSPRPDMDIAGVGCPNPGTSIKVISVETGANLPPGEEGELCCKSLGMMKGYLKNPQATAEAIDETGWLHTGDIGYISDKMTVYVTGRMKELMKLDNHQIAPAEIEQLISTVRGVVDVAVAGIQISEHSRVPMALVVKAEGSDVTEEDIVKCVNENLSEFKQLRAGVVFVESVPRTSTGKIKRKLLEQMADEMYLGDSDLIL